MMPPRLPTAALAVPWRITAALFAGYLLYLFATEYQQLYADAYTYWDLTGRYYYEHRRFSLLSYDSSLRGYLWPLLLFPFRVASFVSGIAPLQLSRVLGAAVAALLFGWAGPAAWEAATRAPLSWRRRVAFAALGFVFWRDYFNFPLADFPALLALLGALALGLRSQRQGRGWLVAAGMLAMAAANMRPIYASSAVVVLLLIGGLAYRQRGRGAVLSVVGTVLLGMAVVAGPQLAINWWHFGRATPLVLARKDPGGTQSLYLFQITWGLAVQKYETTFDPTYPDQRVMFTDPVGQRLMDEEDLSYVYGARDLGHYLRAVSRHLPDVAALYGRHLFNGLDLKYATPYLPRVLGTTLPLSLLNYTMLFGALLVLHHHRHRRPTRGQWLALAVLLVPGALVIPTQMECRFMLPVHLLLYAFVSFLWPREWRTAFGRWPVAVAYGVFMLGCLMLSANTMWHMTNGPRLLWP